MNAVRESRSPVWNGEQGRKAERLGFALFVENLSRPAEFLGQWEQEKKRKRNREAGSERWTTAAIVSMDGQDRSKTRQSRFGFKDNKCGNADCSLGTPTSSTFIPIPLPVLRDLRSSLQPEQDAFKLDGSFLPLFFFHVLKSVRILDSNLKRDQRDTDFSAGRLVDVAGECLGRKKEKKEINYLFPSC